MRRENFKFALILRPQLFCQPSVRKSSGILKVVRIQVQPRAPTAARGPQFLGSPIELRVSYSAERTFNSTVLKLVLFIVASVEQSKEDSRGNIIHWRHQLWDT